jgi:segregation and condensation protein A
VDAVSQLPPVLARVLGEQLTHLPQDLYIPPDALKVILETFEGPLDLLLYLIKRQNLDILDIPIAAITAQYMRYVDLMRRVDIELAGEYLLMAAILAEIKSRMLLPKPNTEEGASEEDPRAELVRRLLEYERYKQAAENIEALPRVERDTFLVSAFLPEGDTKKPLPPLAVEELAAAFAVVLSRAKLTVAHQIARETLSIRERMTTVLERISQAEFTRFDQLFTPEEGRLGVVVTFIALLELLRLSLLELVQAQAYGIIHVKGVANE